MNQLSMRAAGQGLSLRCWVQVEGCTRRLSREKEYYQRYRVCKFHSAQTVVMLAGEPHRSASSAASSSTSAALTASAGTPIWRKLLMPLMPAPADILTSARLCGLLCVRVVPAASACSCTAPQWIIDQMCGDGASIPSHAST